MNKSHQLIIKLFFIVFSFAACSSFAYSQVADTVLINGKIYTLDNTQPWVEAVAIKDGVYIGRGSSEQMRAYIQEKTKVIDLKGKMAMPGINDAHSHLYGGLKALFHCNFPATSTPKQIKQTLTQCIKDNPEQSFIMGGYWASSFFQDYAIASPRAWLDSISMDKAIILSDDSGHNAWVNSKALQGVGFTKNTPDPSDGTIVRDENGEPNGVLYESVVITVEDHFNKNWSKETSRKGMEYTLKTANQFGITGIKDASTRPDDLIALNTIAQNQGLTAHVATSLFTPYGSRDKALDYDYYSQQATDYRADNLHTNFIKFFLDGVPTSSRSAAMLVTYSTDDKHPQATRGTLHLQGDLLANDLIELDKRGFIIKLHAAGDRSVQEALNAIQKVRQVNGNQDKMHEIAHAGFIAEEDISRFKQLNVAIDISPYLWFPSPIIDNIHSVLGDYTNRYWPNKTILEQGGTIIAGSDWPSVSPTLNPWVGIEATVTRKNPYGQAEGVFVAGQALSLAQTLEIFTLNGAKALNLYDKTGSVEIGKYADIIVLNQNLFEIPADKISETDVLQTWFKGRLVAN